MKTLWDEIEKGFETHGASDGGESVSADTASEDTAVEGSTTPKRNTTETPKPKSRLDEAIARRQNANVEEERRKRMTDNVRKLRKHGIRFKPLGK